MECIQFREADDDGTHRNDIIFNAGPGQLLQWPVPRIGDVCSVRQSDKSLYGRVTRVDWYYSSGNRGPVVTVEIRTVVGK